MENQFTQPNTSDRCESSLQPSRSSSLFGRLLSPVLRSLSSALARASRGTLATQLAGTTNLRYYVAILLIAGLSPFSEVVHRFFDQHEGTGYWNTYYFLYAIGPHVSPLLCLSGCFLLFRRKDRLKYVVTIPAAYKIAKIIWLSMVSSNEGFHSFVPMGLLLIGAATAVVWFKIFDYLMSLHFHKRAGTLARIIGIIGAKDVDDKTARRIAQDEIKIYNSLT